MGLSDAELSFIVGWECDGIHQGRWFHLDGFWPLDA